MSLQVRAAIRLLIRDAISVYQYIWWADISALFEISVIGTILVTEVIDSCFYGTGGYLIWSVCCNSRDWYRIFQMGRPRKNGGRLARSASPVFATRGGGCGRGFYFGLKLRALLGQMGRPWPSRPPRCISPWTAHRLSANISTPLFQIAQQSIIIQ